MKIPFDFLPPRQPTKEERTTALLKELLVFAVFTAIIIGGIAAAVSIAYTKASAAYRTHRLATESTMEWYEEQQKLVAKIEMIITTSPTRCSNQTNTLELVRRHELERQRLWAATFRYAGGSQYQGVEKTLPGPIKQINCGVWVI